MSWSVSRAARETGLSKSTISRAIKSGRISAARQHDGSYLIEPAELVLVGGARVSAPVRTLADLARTASTESRMLAAHWAREDADLAARALEWFASHRSVPHKRQACRLLKTAQEDVTR